MLRDPPRIETRRSLARPPISVGSWMGRSGVFPRSLIPALTCLVLALSCAPYARPSFAQATAISTVRDALETLASGDATQRASAALWLGENGREADAASLTPSLKDPDPQVRARAEQAMWRMWSRSGDPVVDRLLANGVELMNSGQLREAIAIFDEVVRRRPVFAEGWNKRATARYLAGDYRRSLADCDEVLRRNPQHFGALSGSGLIHVQLAEYERALDDFRRALAVNPNMQGVRENVRALERLIDARRRRST